MVLEQSLKTTVVVNPEKFDLIVPGSEGKSEVYIGTAKLVLSNDVIQTIVRESEIDIFEVQEPQIAGVSDADIKDESEPVKFEDIIDVNDTDREEDKAIDEYSD